MTRSRPHNPDRLAVQMIFPHALWWHAIQGLGAAPTLTYENFVGLSAAPAELAVCAPGCGCRLVQGLRRSAARAVEEAGFSAVRLNPPAAREILVRQKAGAALS